MDQALECWIQDTLWIDREFQRENINKKKRQLSHLMEDVESPFKTYRQHAVANEWEFEEYKSHRPVYILEYLMLCAKKRKKIFGIFLTRMKISLWNQWFYERFVKCGMVAIILIHKNIDCIQIVQFSIILLIRILSRRLYNLS